jgi:UDP-glucose 4-epimerase
MKILVTGGAGFVGSHTVVELLEAGHEVTILDDFSNSERSVVDRIARITGKRAAVVEGDIRDRAVLDETVGAGYDAVFHFAARKSVAESVAEPLLYYQVNVTGTVNLLEAMSRHGVRTIVFSSSCTVYGDPQELPVTEDHPFGPAANPYGRTKQMMEHALMDLAAADRSWRIASLRYFNPVGAHPSGLIGEDPQGVPDNLMPYVTRVAAGRLPELRIFGNDYPTPDGTGVRDYVHVVDLARGHLAALDYVVSAAGYHAWNLGTGQGSSVLELVETFQRVTGRTVPYRFAPRRPGDVPATWADPSKAERELGWKAIYGLADMCRDAWRWESSR